MALGSFVAGRSAMTYTVPGGSALDCGISEGGYEIQVKHAKELVQESDAYGQMVIDAIARGISDVFIQSQPIEWKQGVLNAMLPYGAAFPPSGAGYLGPGVIGRLDSAVAGAVILTAVSGTPGAAAPASLTAALAVIAEGADVKIVLDSKLRKMPIRLRVYPYSDSGTIKFFTVT
jgi:hypothetical protein